MLSKLQRLIAVVPLALIPLRVQPNSHSQVAITPAINQQIERLLDLSKSADPQSLPDYAQNYQTTVVAPCSAQGGHIEGYNCVIPPKPQPVQTSNASLTDSQPATSDVTGIVVYWANYYGFDASYALKIAYCESTYNPLASNGTHCGLFQFSPATYAYYAPLAGAGSDYWDANNNARTALYMLSRGMESQWQCA